MKSRSWVIIIVLTIAIKWVSLYPGWIERNYSRGVYPFLAKVQRFLFGWLPISVGDLFYAFLCLVVIYKTMRLIRLIWKKQMNRQTLKTGMQQLFFFLLFMYVLFNLFWGLNYNRRGIAYQLNLEVKTYSTADLDTLTQAIQAKLNANAAEITMAQRDSFHNKQRLFAAASEAYAHTKEQYPFLTYESRSVKPSIYSYLGNYLGFQGYYNPFSGEAQVNTTIPSFLEPYVSCHEIAHQLGYGKENEANFVGYLACRNSPVASFRYSVYLDLYNYALGEVYSRDTVLFKRFQDSVHPQVIKDQKAFRSFYRRYNNPIQDLVMWGYGYFLKANNQPSGKKTYNEVVAWLIAYYKKYGIGAI